MNRWREREYKQFRQRFENTEAYPLITEAGLDEWPYFHGFRRGRWDGSLGQLRELVLGYRTTRGLGETRLMRLRKALVARGLMNECD